MQPILNFITRYSILIGNSQVAQVKYGPPPTNIPTTLPTVTPTTFVDKTDNLIVAIIFPVVFLGVVAAGIFAVFKFSNKNKK